jgi:putative NADPH-quinone reductase
VRALLVVAHPVAESYGAALAQAAERGLRAAGHEVRVLDLYADGFDPVLSDRDWVAYYADGGDALVDPALAPHAEAARWAEIYVFVYPTWWAGMPAIMKGWLERVLVPGVAFVLDERTRKVTPALAHVRRVVGVTTYGSRRAYVHFIGDGGRRTVTRALRLVCGRGTRARWLALYGMDARTDADRHAFLARVEAAMGAL